MKATEKQKLLMRERAKNKYYSLTPKEKKELRARVQKSVRKWREKNPEKARAHRVVFIELRAGRMKKGTCFCGDTKTEAHHTDYSKPLEVIWYCRKHHREADRNR